MPVVFVCLWVWISPVGMLHELSCTCFFSCHFFFVVGIFEKKVLCSCFVAFVLLCFVLYCANVFACPHSNPPGSRAYFVCVAGVGGWYVY